MSFGEKQLHGGSETKYIVKVFSIKRTLTGFRVHGEVRLALQDAVDHLGAVPVRGVVCICRCHLNHRSAWKKEIHDNDLDQLLKSAEKLLSG